MRQLNDFRWVWYANAVVVSCVQLGALGNQGKNWRSWGWCGGMRIIIIYASGFAMLVVYITRISSRQFLRFTTTVGLLIYNICRGSPSFPYSHVSLSSWWFSQRHVFVLAFMGISLSMVRQRFVNSSMVRQWFVNGSSIRQWFVNLSLGSSMGFVNSSSIPDTCSSILTNPPLIDEPLTNRWRTNPPLTNHWRIDEPLTNHWRSCRYVLTIYSAKPGSNHWTIHFVTLNFFSYVCKINSISSSTLWHYLPASKNYSILLGLRTFLSEIKENHGRAHSFDCNQRLQAWTWNLVLHAQEEVSQGNRLQIYWLGHFESPPFGVSMCCS